MGPLPLHPDEFELENRFSLESNESFDLDDADFESQPLAKSRSLQRPTPFARRLLSFLPPFLRRRAWKYPKRSSSLKTRQRVNCARRPSFLRICYIFHAFLGIILAVAVLTSIFHPSYTHRPLFYNELRERALNENSPGRANTYSEKVFIAASIYDPDGELADGPWGEAVLKLIDLLGEDNVFLSIYENDGGSVGAAALKALEKKVKCKSSLNFEARLDPENLPHITLPDGSKRIKRIAYLAEVRNRALLPLDEELNVKYDKLLYLNDVIFDPIEAAQLLFLTNANENGKAQYKAACSVDFINPFKFYDTFAARDLDGYGMGIPFYPWFTSAGSGLSREDVLGQSDAVRVHSCWGGMVAFDARYFQQGDGTPKSPTGLRFRAEKDLYWDSSECCLIHADLLYPISPANEILDTQIYMNPYIRVAYDSRTLSWLAFTRRFERLYSPAHNILNRLVGLPWYNPRREEVSDQEVEEKVWIEDAKAPGNGSFQIVNRIAGNSGYCGHRALSVMREHRKPGQKNWESLPLPTGKA